MQLSLIMNLKIYDFAFNQFHTRSTWNCWCWWSNAMKSLPQLIWHMTQGSGPVESCDNHVDFWNLTKNSSTREMLLTYLWYWHLIFETYTQSHYHSTTKSSIGLIKLLASNYPLKLNSSSRNCIHEHNVSTIQIPFHLNLSIIKPLSSVLTSWQLYPKVED